MMHKLIRLKRDIRAQEAALLAQRRAITGNYGSLKARYHRQLTSPTALTASFAAGLVVGTLARRSRRQPPSGSRRQRRQPWLGLARSIGGPALVYFLRAKAARIVGSADT